MGSVKEVVVEVPPSEKESGRGFFVFSDGYSVFDWGRMGEIPGKGFALALISAKFHELAQERGISTCYLGVCESPGSTPRSLAEVVKPTNCVAVKVFRKVLPVRKESGYSYEPLRGITSNYLVPLEVIYRNEVGENSSLARRLKEGSWSPADFGRDEIPLNEPLKEPLLDFSTKFEDTDRYLRRGEALELSGLGEEEFSQMERSALSVARLITEIYEPLEIKNVDGKLEFAVDDEGELTVVDVFGTPDECRLLFRSTFDLSKQILRDFYRSTEWGKRVEELKSSSPDWREKAGEPPPLPEEVKRAVSLVYQSLANAVLGRELFPAPPLSEAAEEARGALSRWK